MTGLTGRVHSMARVEGRHDGLGAAAREEEATLGRRSRRRKREAGGAGWAKRPSEPADCWAD
jgi:hypothetical protein